jgi:hypothetical protein
MFPWVDQAEEQSLIYCCNLASLEATQGCHPSLAAVQAHSQSEFLSVNHCNHLLLQVFGQHPFLPGEVGQAEVPSGSSQESVDKLVRVGNNSTKQYSHDQ